MKVFKQRISNIKRKVEERLPQEGDILGFPGVTRKVILNALEDIHALAQGIEVRDDGTLFPVVALKRLEDKVKDDLDDFLSDGAQSKDKLNKFIDKLAQLYEKTKSTYYIISKDGYYNEIELSKLLKAHSDIKDAHNKYSAQIAEFEKDYNAAQTQIESWQDEIDEFKQQLETTLSANTASTAKISALEKNAIEKTSNIDEFHQNISDINEKTEGWKDEILLAKTNINKLELSYSTLFKSLSELEGRTKSLADISEKLESRNRDLLDQILSTLATANRAGLSASFREMKEELQNKQKNWQILFVSSLGILTIVILALLFSSHDNSILNWSKFLGKMPIASPIVWLAWFSARQYSLTNRVREDYGFKYSVSMAFEGYKQASEEVDPEMVKNLLKLSVLNISENPIRLYAHPSQDHASPVTEFIERVLNPLKGKTKIKNKDIEVTHDSSTTNAEQN